MLFIIHQETASKSIILKYAKFYFRIISYFFFFLIYHIIIPEKIKISIPIPIYTAVLSSPFPVIAFETLGKSAKKETVLRQAMQNKTAFIKLDLYSFSFDSTSSILDLTDNNSESISNAVLILLCIKFGKKLKDIWDKLYLFKKEYKVSVEISDFFISKSELVLNR